jgi:GNAT superfamily N-acetyltransferase
VKVRGYRADDEEAVIDCWNAALSRDPIDASTFRRKVLLDPNFDPRGLLIADEGGEVVGLCLCLIRRVPLERSDLQPDLGWITAFGVRPTSRGRGAGTALIDAARHWFADAGRRSVSIAAYVPSYFVPGVDVSAYAEGLAFLTARGWIEVDRPISMDANLVNLDVEPHLRRQPELVERGVEIRSLQVHEVPLLMAMLQAHMPHDWVRHARDILVDVSRGLAGWDQFTVAVHGGEMVGYCQFEGEHFGPFGVVEEWQSQGIGTVLLARCLQAMQRRGLHGAWVLWTSDRTAEHVYGRFGFQPTRRFAVLRLDL